MGVLVKVILNVLVSLLIGGTISHAEDLYVAPNGSDMNPGTVNAPFQSLARAYYNAAAGTTIYLRAGVYQPTSKVVLSRSGANGNPIRIFAYPSETPVIDGTKESERWRSLIEITGNYHHVRGLEVRNASNMGVSILRTGSNNILERLNVHHCGRVWDEGSGISIFENAANNLLLNNDVHHNYAPLVPGNADGMRSSSRGTGNILRGNRSYKNADDGFDMWNGTPTILEGNIAFENGYDDNFKRLGDGNGFKLGGNFSNATSGGHTLYNNVSFKNPMHGFDENNASFPLTLINNSAFMNGPETPGGVNWAANYGLYKAGHIARNNVSLGKLGEINATQSANSWNLNPGITAAEFISTDDSALRGPRNSDGSLPISNFLRPAANSRLIDQGVDAGRPFVGRAPDIGAYESGVTTPTPSPVSAPVPAPAPAPTPTPTPTPTPGSSALQNGSFEDGATAWEDWGKTVISREYAAQGLASLKVTGEGGRGQTVALKAGAAYVLKFSAKRKSTGGEGCTVGVSFKDAGGKQFSSPSVMVTSRTAANLALKFQVPAKSAGIKVFVWKDAGANACYVDNFTITGQ